MHAAARCALIEYAELLALLEAPGDGRQRAHIHHAGTDVQEVRHDPADFRIHHANKAGAAGHLYAQKFLDRETPGMFLVHRRAIIEPVEIRHALQVSLVLQQLFRAAMEQADMAIHAGHDLAVEIEDHAKHAVSGRVLGAEVQRKLAVVHVCYVCGVGHGFSLPSLSRRRG